jgi:predicted transcriptional regulator YdeE
MKKTLFIVLLLTAGCIGTEENASANLKKGDEFFAKNEYEVAEYYYERIPEESPLHAKAQVKLEEIAKIKKQWVEKEVPVSELANIIVREHTYKIDKITRIAVHRLSMVNRTVRYLEYITVQFEYYDANDQFITRYTVETRTPMKKNTQGVFGEIESGVVTTDFARSTATIIKARFQ